MSLTDRNVFALAVIGYGVSAIYSVFLWRKGFQRDDRINYTALALSFVAHTSAMAMRGFSLSRCPVNNLFEAMMFVMWTIVATYLVVGLFSRLRFVGAFASPILFAIGIFALMPGLDTPNPKASKLASLHAALILLAYRAFGLGSGAAVMYFDGETRTVR